MNRYRYQEKAAMYVIRLKAIIMEKKKKNSLIMINIKQMTMKNLRVLLLKRHLQRLMKINFKKFPEIQTFLLICIQKTMRRKLMM
jgi:hypothetical protein